MDMTIDLQDFSRKNIYEMVETTAYFEAYNPILEGLQQTKEEDLPFQVSNESWDTDLNIKNRTSNSFLGGYTKQSLKQDHRNFITCRGI